MKALIFILVVLIGGAYFAGYRVHPENVRYYFKTEESGKKYEILLNNGVTMEGIVESETEGAIEINTDGAVLSFQKAEIKSMKEVAGRNFI